jgi:hypothetical protein
VAFCGYRLNDTKVKWSASAEEVGKMSDLKDLERRIERIEKQLGIQNQSRYKFEELVEGLDRRTFEMIWTGVDTYNIAVSLIGLTAGQVKKVKESFSKTRWAEITNEYQNPSMQEITESSIRVNREVILKKIHALERRAEIVIARGSDNKGELLSWDEIRDNQGPFVDVNRWVQSEFDKP